MRRLGSTQDPTLNLPPVDVTDLPLPPVYDPLIDPGNPLLNTPPVPTLPPIVTTAAAPTLPWYVWAGVLAVVMFWPKRRG